MRNSSEGLRAPDPTLDALGQDLVQLVVTLRPTAHRYVGALGPRASLPCGSTLPRGQTWELMLAEHARWVAVPCRGCFPDAPEPGHEFCRVKGQDDRVHTAQRRGRGLAWQTD